jgi:hypothetical protein
MRQQAGSVVFSLVAFYHPGFQKGESHNMDNLDRLRNLFIREEQDQEEKGCQAGERWACEHATPILARIVHSLRGKKLSSSGFFYRVVTEALHSAGEDTKSFGEIFGGHLVDGNLYSEAFLRGFVNGAGKIWDAVRRQKTGIRADRTAARGALQDAVSQQNAWRGWHRGEPKQAWLEIVAGATEKEVLDKLATRGIGGEKMVLPAGKHPDSAMAS